jgi:hypothetical protein
MDRIIMPTATERKVSALGLLRVLAALSDRGFEIKSPGKRKTESHSYGTLELVYSNAVLGWVNSDALSDGVVGYNFPRFGHSSGRLSANDSVKLVDKFYAAHSCSASDISFHPRTKTPGVDPVYLIILKPEVALRILLSDADFFDGLAAP